MKPEILKYFHDILSSIDSIDSFLGEQRDFNKYMEDKMLRRAVEREIEIIGEAMNRILNIDPQIEISSSRQIIGMRNRVIHGYDDVDDEIVWGTIQRHLPILKSEIQELMKWITFL
ncbi:MAG TPA: HepT-like ribonuclease domain-containing protein [Bacteroidales bacterium]|nr:HepT-like ribonuclease domain-containing protein [Bacteroidales bacterium]